MFLVPVNYLAVLVCGVMAMVIGMLWYGPLFGKEWSKMIGLTPDKKKKAQSSMTQNYSIMFIGSLIMAYVLAHLVWYAAPGSLTMVISVKTAVWAWLGFVATTSLSKFVFSPDKKPMQLWYIESGYYLVTLMVMGVILAILK